MPLKLPNLDDRTYEQLREEALDVIKRNLDTDWNDLSPGDPGIVLMELFAYLTEQLLYRVNRLPRKLYIAFLRLLGVTQHPPKAAKIAVSFARQRSADDEAAGEDIILPAGVRLVAATGDDLAPELLFYTAEEILLPAGRSQPVTTTVRQFEYIGNERLGVANGRPGLSFTVSQPPLVAPMGTMWDLVVGVELTPKEMEAMQSQTGQLDAGGAMALSLPDGQQSTIRKSEDGKLFRIWQPVDNFANLEAGGFVYLVDRLDGIIQFAPAVRLLARDDNDREHLGYANLSAIPPKNSEIRAWYPRGGGAAGNLYLEADDLSWHRAELERDPRLQSVDIQFLERLEIGLDGESLENALARGPVELFTRKRAVTTEDFQTIVASEAQGLVVRSQAFTRFEKWRHAVRGTVEVVMVPETAEVQLRHRQAGPRQLDWLRIFRESQNDYVTYQVQRTLAERTPAGSKTELIWARYKRVSVAATVRLLAGVDKFHNKRKLESQLEQWLSPLAYVQNQASNQNQIGYDSSLWDFGRELRLKDLYFFLSQQQDVTQVLDVSVSVDAAPTRITADVAADFHQPQTWYAADDDHLFRSTDNGLGWEIIADISAESKADRSHFDLLAPCPYQPGIVAATALTQSTQAGPWFTRLYLTFDCWESGLPAPRGFYFRVEDMAWLRRAQGLFLLLATDKGLFELKIADGDGVPVPEPVVTPITVDLAHPAIPCTR